MSIPLKDDATHIARGGPMPRIVSIQYLRAFAALSVALYHVLNQVEFLTNTILPYHNLLSTGVDLFFAISGFIIWTTTWYSCLSTRDFIWNRVTRVVPMYWIFTLLAVLVSPLSNYISKGVSLHAVIYSLLFIPYSSWNTWPVLGVGWTLNYEMFFYAMFALLLFFFGRNNLFSILMIVMAVLVGVGAVEGFSLPIASVYTNILLLEFMFGIAIGKLVTEDRLLKNRYFGSACIIVGLVILLCTPNYSWEVLEARRPLLWGWPNALILMGAVSLELSLLRVTKIKALALLGDASFAIYLTHAFPIMVMAKILKMAWWPHTALGFCLFAIATMVVIIVVGIIVHLYVERPLLRLAKNTSIFSPLKDKEIKAAPEIRRP